MYKAYLRKAWKVGRTYYFMALIGLLAVMVFVVAEIAFIIGTISPETIHGVKMPINEAVIFSKIMLTLILVSIISLFVSILSSTIVLGTIQADIQNGVFEVLFGNGMDDSGLIKALYITGVSSFIIFYVLAEIMVIVALSLTAPFIISSLLSVIVLVPLGVGFFTAGFSVFVGLSKPKYFKISTGFGATKNLAFTVVSLPSLIILILVLAPLITVAANSTSYPTALLQILNTVLVVTSIVMMMMSVIIAVKTPVNRVGLITKGEE
ncbi:MAG: hypothetical protein ACP5NQ_07150 [Vulcanisaeta sp.]